MSPITDAIIEQLMEVRRQSNCPNMFDTNAVQRIAFDNGWYELVNLIETDRKAYVTLILTGGRGDVE